MIEKYNLDFLNSVLKILDKTSCCKDFLSHLIFRNMLNNELLSNLAVFWDSNSFKVFDVLITIQSMTMIAVGNILLKH